jgi:hypothetical protein
MDVPRYFDGFSYDLTEADPNASLPARVADPGGASLPFDYLDHRSFEIGLRGANSAEEFRQALLESVRIRADLLKATFNQWMTQVPSQLLVISDSMSVLDDQDLLKRMMADTQLLSSMRGSDLLAE